MSAPNLHAFLTKLHNELQRHPDADTYRKSTGDMKTHTFTFDSADIKEGIQQYINIATNDPTSGLEDFEKDLDAQLQVLTRLIKIKFKQFVRESESKNYDASLGIETPTSIVITIAQVTGGKTIKIFGKVRDLYQDILNKWYENRFLKIVLKEGKIERKATKGTSTVRNAGRAFNLAHKKGSNIHHLIHDAMHAALYDELNDDSLEYNNLTPEVRELLDTVETILTVVKNLELGEVTVSLGNAYINAQLGGGEEKKMMQALRDALEKLETHNIQGSDSLSDATRKKHVRKIIEPIKKIARKNKNITLIHEDWEIDKPYGGVEKKVKRSMKKDSTKKKSIKKPKLVTQDSKSMFTIMAMINQKLPATVRKNMGAPRLENVSGRFAQSVKLTDVSQTQKGYPSFGYTYQKDPYQIFETGRGPASWANGERDPRQLIDSSIRELAATLALGRFYTRRQ